MASPLGSIADVRELSKLPAPVLSILGGMGSPALAAPTAPAVTLNPAISTVSSDPLTTRQDALEADLYNRQHPTAPSTVLGKIGHTAANIGNVLGNIFSPVTMALTPGTALNNALKINQDRAQLEEVSQEKTARTVRAATEATTAYTQARPAIEQGKLDQKRQAANNRLTQALAKNGQVPTFDEDGNLTDTSDDPESQAFKDRVALSALRDAGAEKEKIQAEIAQNGFKPGTPEYEARMQRARALDARNAYLLGSLGVHQQELGVHKERLAFDEDKTYDPQPTGQQRTKKDLADSASHFVDIMHDVRNAHPEFFGPGQGRATKFQEWLGSQDPEAQRYLQAATVAKDHLTAVFGARSKYALEGTGSLFDTKMNNDAFNASYGDLKTSLGGFQKAGSTHDNRPGLARPNVPSQGSDQSLGSTNKPDGVYEMNGSRYHVRGGKVYAH